MKITLISDTHNKHNQITNDLIGGDLLLHSGDISSMGTEMEIFEFCKWFDKLDNYKNKIFIAGNHDWGFQNNVDEIKKIVNHYDINYLQDNTKTIKIGKNKINIYGSPWQPEFYNWAFNLPRNGEELLNKWNQIPNNTDILLTHGPAWGILDDVQDRRGTHLGCELLSERIKFINPKIHICGHIHSGHGYYYDGFTHYFNASVLDEKYQYSNGIFHIDWDPITNEIKFL